MTKTYAAPALITSGDVVSETRKPTKHPYETVSIYRPVFAGSVGFGL